VAGHADLDRLPNAVPRTAPAPTLPPPPVVVAGRALPDRATWQLTTRRDRGFAVTVDGVSHPAVVFELPSWTAEPRRPMAPPGRAGRRARSGCGRRGVGRYRCRPGLPERRGSPRPGLNQRWASRISAATRVRRRGHRAGGRAAERRRSRPGGAPARAKERLLCDRDYPMQVGSHENYWPYWRNFAARWKALAQTAPGTDDYWQLKHRRLTRSGPRRPSPTSGARSTRKTRALDRHEAAPPAVVDGRARGCRWLPGSAPTQPRYEVLTAADGAAVHRDGRSSARSIARRRRPPR
jgi:hypothetical protein